MLEAIAKIESARNELASRTPPNLPHPAEIAGLFTLH